MVLKHNDDTNIESDDMNGEKALYEVKDWTVAIDTYCKSNNSRGVPSLGSDLCSFLLLPDPITKRYHTVVEPLDIRTHPIYRRILELVDGYILSLKQHSKFPKLHTADDSPNNNNNKYGTIGI